VKVCESCGKPARLRLPDGSHWCWACDGSARALGYDDARAMPSEVLSCPAVINVPNIEHIPCSLALGHGGLHQSGPAGPWRNVSWGNDVSPAWSAEGGAR
jgi:hypothetical protein